MAKHKRAKPSDGYIARLLRQLADMVASEREVSRMPSTVHQARAAAARLSSAGRPAPRSQRIMAGAAVAGIVLMAGHADARTHASIEESTCTRLRMEQPDYSGAFAVAVHRPAFDYGGNAVDDPLYFRCNTTAGGEDANPRTIVIYSGRHIKR